MAKKAIDFLKTLITKAGGNLDDEKIKPLLAALNIETELPDEITTLIDNGLLSLNAAKNSHPEIKNHYFALAYKGVDSEIERLIAEEKLPDEIAAEIRAESSSTKRAALIARKLKELEAKKSTAGNSEKAQLNSQILELNNQLRAEKESINKIKEGHQKDLTGVKLKYALRNILSQYKTIHDELDPDTKQIILDAVINKHLAAKKASFGVTDSDELTLAGEGGTNLFTEDNRLLTPKAFLEKVLADEKILKVNDQNNNNQNNNTQRNNNNNSGRNNQNNGNNNYNGRNRQQDGDKPKGNQVLQDLIKRSQDDLSKSQKNIF